MAKANDIFDADGRLIILGRTLGSGGEGKVYEVPTVNRELVAKIYHKPLSVDKQEKIIAMTKDQDARLHVIAAWPLTTLHLGRNGPVRGFLMAKITDYEPIHKLYSPAQRKTQFPKADWSFLISVARNVAVAFENIHNRNHIIGDVNQGNVYFSNKALVKLIDSDSFQINERGKVFRCDVGVPHFTPPELLIQKSFSHVQRSTNHDNFGLAILCFHLLFMGRHPFSGLYSGSGDMPIEKAIEGYRYAYGMNSSSRGMSPPPNSPLINIIPRSLGDYFERAFTEAGSRYNGRPTAREWVSMLEYLRNNLRTCDRESMHKFFGGLSDCPWCSFEQKSGVIFFLGVFSSSSSHVNINILNVWQRIISIPSPGEAPHIDPNLFNVRPKPLPNKIKRARAIMLIRRVIAVVLFVGTLAVYPSAWIIVLLISIYLFSSSAEIIREEKNIRTRALDTAERSWIDAVAKWKKDAGDIAFRDKLNELDRLRKQYEALGSDYNKELQKLQNTVQQRQLHKFLERFLIYNHRISNIGEGRKSTLASFGIETAADVDAKRIRKIKGFGESLTNELVTWRKGLESKFRYDPSKGIDPSDIDDLKKKFAQQRIRIEGALLAGPEQLNKMKDSAIGIRGARRTEIESLARSVAQARADMSLIR
jgi:DNA-binding helix-hairpin-helix protein with protein kinase domain